LPDETLTSCNPKRWGFNLDASLREGPLPTVKDHVLTLESNQFAKLDSLALPTHEYLPASEHPSHAHNAKKIGDLFPDKSYDDFYLLQNPGTSQIPIHIPLTSFNANLDLIKDVVQPTNDAQGSATHGKRPRSVAELSSDKSGIKLLFDTNQPGVMFYANGGANPAVGARKKIHGGSGFQNMGDSYSPGTAAFLEFHEPISAFLDPKNKGGNDSLLTTDELYHNYVRCDVRFKPIVGR